MKILKLIPKLPVFLRTMWHLRAQQVIARLRLMVRRKWRVWWAAWYRKQMHSADLPSLAPRESLPLPQFPVRDHLVEVENDQTYRLSFLNTSREFAHPFNWHPSEFERGTRLWLLNLHYMEYLEGLSDERFRKVVEDWISNVPPYREDYWKDDWNSYAVSIRTVVWMQQYAVRCERLPRGFKKRMLASIIHQLRFLRGNIEFDVKGNHIIKNIKALLWGGRFWSHSEALEWRRTGIRLLRQELQEQILEDGVHFERSPSYHLQVFSDLVECYQTLDDVDSTLKEKLEDVLSRMAQVSVDLRHPDGKIGLFNDSGLNMTYGPSECIEAWKDVVGGEIEERKIFSLPQAGYYGLREKDEYVLVDCGKVSPDHIPAHGHGDIFSFEWTIGGQRVIVDTGVYEYNPGPRREYSRSTRAHNTVTLDGRDQCEFWGAFRMGRRAKVGRRMYNIDDFGFELEGYHNGYESLEGGPIHYRKFDIRPSQIKIKDKIEGGAGQNAIARLILHPSCSICDKERGHMINVKKESINLKTSGHFEVKSTLWFPDFGEQKKCIKILIHYGESPCEGSFLLRKI